MIALQHYIRRFNVLFGNYATAAPWSMTASMEKILLEKIGTLGPEFRIFKDVAIHRSAVIDSHAILKGPAIISGKCFIGAHAYLRGGTFLDDHVSIGPGCEVKTSFIFSDSALGHFNYVGDSLLGSNVNFEAGAVIANHFNERKNKNITVTTGGKTFSTGIEKFGALVGDHAKVGANAVLSPGTVLEPETIVKRLQLIDQTPLQE